MDEYKGTNFKIQIKPLADKSHKCGSCFNVAEYQFIEFHGTLELEPGYLCTNCKDSVVGIYDLKKENK